MIIYMYRYTTPVKVVDTFYLNEIIRLTPSFEPSCLSDTVLMEGHNIRACPDMEKLFVNYPCYLFLSGPLIAGNHPNRAKQRTELDKVLSQMLVPYPVFFFKF